MDLPFNLDNITMVMFVLARMSGCIFMNPILGRRNVPAVVKTAIVLMLTIVIYTYSRIEVPKGLGSVTVYTVLLLKEFMVGYLIGTIVTFFTAVIILGGELIDFQIGISMAKIFDAQSNMSVALTSTFYNIVFTFLFFLSGGHLTLIRYFLDSAKVVPYGEVMFGKEISTYVLDVFCDTTILAVKLAMPIISIGFMMEIGVGILMKLIPQVNIFVINVQLKLFVGLLIIVIMYAPAVSFLENLIKLMFEGIETGLRVMA